MCVLYCGCFNLFCNTWVCVCMGFVMCGCFDCCVGVLVIYIYLLCFVFRLCIFLFVTSVRTAATE